MRCWLHLRLHAWLRGRSFESIQVTPHYLRQIDASHCPVTRAELSADGEGGDTACIARVRADAGYAAGNLAVMSRRAKHANAGCGHREVWRLAALAAESDPAAQGLSAAEWQRLAVLHSFVETLPHAEACAQPLLVLPPNRLRLFNPAQALQAMLCRQLLVPGWSRRIRRFEELLPGTASQRDFTRFFFALLPRVLEAGPLADSTATRWGDRGCMAPCRACCSNGLSSPSRSAPRASTGCSRRPRRKASRRRRRSR